MRDSGSIDMQAAAQYYAAQDGDMRMGVAQQLRRRTQLNVRPDSRRWGVLSSTEAV
jgi:hypothetical protein